MCEWGDTVSVEVNGVTRSVDRCIATIVLALNNVGLTTVASCCGHGKCPGNIALADGREIIICTDYESARKIDKIFPPINET